MRSRTLRACETRPPKHFPEGDSHAGLASLGHQLTYGRARDDHEIVALGKIAGGGPEGLSEQALHPVAVNRSAHLAPHRDTEARAIGAGRTREGVENQVTAGV